MRRCGIVVIYNKEGFILPYVEVLLDSVKEILDKLVVIINGNILDEGKEKIKKRTEYVYFRKNIGYDGGAYKDVFIEYLKDEEWGRWDEILLMNDTFYGPFFPWQDVFMLMENDTCDFWGLSCYPKGETEFFDGQVVPVSQHVQSYFIVIKRKMFLSCEFLKFWNELDYPLNYKEAVLNFEVHFSEYFMSVGFSYASWIEKQQNQLFPQEDLCLLCYEDWMIKLRFPIYKRKEYSLLKYKKQKELFEFLQKNSFFPLWVIKDDVCMRCYQGKLKPYNPKMIKTFCCQYKKIYLFGMGKHAEVLESFLNDNGVQICGHIVSEVKEKSRNVYEIGEFCVKPDMGIIVALNRKNVKEVYDVLKEQIPYQQIIFPQYD